MRANAPSKNPPVIEASRAEPKDAADVQASTAAVHPVAADAFAPHICGGGCGHPAVGAARREELVSSGRVPPRTEPKTIQAGGFSIKTSGIGQPGIQEAINIAKRLTERLDIARRLQDNKVDLVLLPHDKKLTDLPEFAQLKGKKTFDGRLWDDVRGVANVQQSNGRVAVAMPEENLIELPSDPYRGNFSVGLHEVAHAVHRYGITASEQAEILESYRVRKAAGGPFTDAYAGSNEYEYFAQATTAYLSRNEGQGQNGPEWLKKNDPRIYALLEKVFGPPSPFDSVDWDKALLASRASTQEAPAQA